MIDTIAVENELRSILARIAPDADLAALDRDADLREELDIDSMDFVNFAAALAERFSVTVPQPDYAELTTLRRAAAYLAPRIAEATTPS